jgi:hypothetical protein
VDFGERDEVDEEEGDDLEDDDGDDFEAGWVEEAPGRDDGSLEGVGFFSSLCFLECFDSSFLGCSSLPSSCFCSSFFASTLCCSSEFFSSGPELAPPEGVSPGSSLKRSLPTSTVSSSLAKISTIVPDCGALTETSI